MGHSRALLAVLVCLMTHYPTTTRDRTTRQASPCPATGRPVTLLDCLRAWPGGCLYLLPSLQCRCVRPFSGDRQEVTGDGR